MTFDPEAFCACPQRRDEHLTGDLRTEGGLWVGLVSSGSCTLGSLPFPAGPGDLFLGVGPLSLWADAVCHLALLQCTGCVPDQIAAGLDASLLLPGSACPQAGQHISLLLSGELSPGRTSSLAYTLLCELWQAQRSVARPPSLVSEAIALMGETYATLYGVEDVADHLGVSKCHLIRLFSAAVGQPPGRYLTEIRLTAAKELLLCRAYTLDAIAGLCGFSGANYFCRVFRRVVGTTPSAWLAANAHRPSTGKLPVIL